MSNPPHRSNPRKKLHQSLYGDSHISFSGYKTFNARNSSTTHLPTSLVPPKTYDSLLGISDPSANFRNSVKSRWGAPQTFLEETARQLDAHYGNVDPFEATRTKTIQDRENDYTRRWRQRSLSPERHDPFSKQKQTIITKTTSETPVSSVPTAPVKKRTYSEIYSRIKLDKDLNTLRYKILQRKKRGGKTKES